jgi:hypothetical protein
MSQPLKFDAIDRDNAAVRQVLTDERLFLALAGSSFLESAAPLYTQNLAAYYRDNDEIVRWLERTWLPEEAEHGRAGAIRVRLA